MPYSRSGLSAPAKQKAHMSCPRLSPHYASVISCHLTGRKAAGCQGRLEASPVSVFVSALNMISR